MKKKRNNLLQQPGKLMQLPTERQLSKIFGKWVNTLVRKLLMIETPILLFPNWWYHLFFSILTKSLSFCPKVIKMSSKLSCEDKVKVQVVLSVQSKKKDRGPSLNCFCENLPKHNVFAKNMNTRSLWIFYLYFKRHLILYLNSARWRQCWTLLSSYSIQPNE